jgi:hypothetical protein
MSILFGAVNRLVSCNNSVVNPTVFTIMCWFKTTSTTGGVLIGFGASQSSLSSNYDRLIYMLNNGSITFGVYTGVCVTINSGTAYNDGAWHHVAASISSSGMVLYVDGVQVGTNSNTVPQNFTGYWKIGYENLSGWPGTVSSNYYFIGSIDDARVYTLALSTNVIQTIATVQGKDGVYDSIFFRWKLNEGGIGSTATTIQDTSYGANHGAASNTPTYDEIWARKHA